MSRIAHLASRFSRSLSSTEPSPTDTSWAHDHLLAGERDLWDRMRVEDRRHSIEVARDFVDRRPTADREEIAGALLHDVGKIDSDLGTMTRVVATIVGPRGDRFRSYHDHESIGADLARRAGSGDVTIALIRGEGPAADALRAADG